MTSAQPKHQAFNIGVKALVVRGGCILLLKRRDVAKWEVPGGRINVGEDATQTLLRELPEELPGCQNVQLSHLVHAAQQDFILPNGNRLMLLFFRVTADLPYIVSLSDEHIAADWASAATLASYQLQKPILEAAQLALQP
ncbi:MAG TPA: NUDIX hydrolase [Candidatus Saccharimonadales bacterium]|nr:NUDIX hydrolase [Candidatus Saccharimonadales bacterium]